LITVLLPGLNGSENLFLPYLSLPGQSKTQVITYPQQGDQSYQALVPVVRALLPDEDFILVAESFGGPIAASLSKDNNPNLKGVVFVATFLSTSRRYLHWMARWLPFKRLVRLPSAKVFVRKFLLTDESDETLLELILQEVESLPQGLINERIQSILALRLGVLNTDLPVIYLSAGSDVLVPKSKLAEFQLYYSNLTVKHLDGPHCLIQTHPEGVEQIVRDFILSIENRGSKNNS